MIYFATFETHWNCQIQSHVWHGEARNATEAKQKCREHWNHIYRSEKKTPYQFHLYAKRSRIQDKSKLCVHDWLNRKYSGTNVMGFIMTDIRTWRVNGRNLYGHT